MISLGNNTTTNKIALEETFNEAVAEAVNEAVAQIPEPYAPSYYVLTTNITKEIGTTSIVGNVLQNDFLQFSDSYPSWRYISTGTYELIIPGSDLNDRNTYISVSLNNVGSGISSNRPPFTWCYVKDSGVVEFKFFKGDNSNESDPTLTSPCSIEIRQYK
jgi:hypothetical protein